MKSFPQLYNADIQSENLRTDVSNQCIVPIKSPRILCYLEASASPMQHLQLAFVVVRHLYTVAKYLRQSV